MRDQDPVTDAVRARVFAKFRSMRHRQTNLSFVPCGITVEAADPAELESATARALALLEEFSGPS
jgi:hypothetical protein